MGLTVHRRDGWIPWTVTIVAATSVYAAAVALTGGFKVTVGFLRFSSHSWERPAAVAAIGAIALAINARARIAVLLRRLAAVVESIAFRRSAVAAAAVWTLVAGIAFGTFANGGADSYGYVGQARLLAPMYPPGFPLLLAPFSALGEKATYLVVPMFGVLLIWMTYRLGSRSGDPSAGALAAVFLAVSPTFLYQIVQPMSDIPCAACWTAALVLASRGSARSAIASGAISSLAILIRPNLAPLAAIILALTISSSGSGHLRRAVYFVASIVPGIALLGWIQLVRYGSPLASGYGPASDMFSLSNVIPNLARYPYWITQTHTPFIWISVAAPFWIIRRATHRPLAWASAVLGVAVWFAHLPYVFFERNEWFYTRFLLPSIVVMLVFASAAALSVLRLPILVVDVSEYQSFRQRFAATHQQAIDQLTPLAVLGDARVFAFR